MQGRVRELDGLRGIAVLSVVAYHATLLRLPQGGFFGVDLFFVLSGYLITGLLLSEHERTGVISLRGFYRRRARRLLPALVFLLAAGLVVGCVALAEHRISARYLLEMAGASTYTTNFFAMFNHLGVGAHWIGGLWSLGAEEQFYLVWPLLLIWLLRRYSQETIRRVLVGAFALSVIGFYATAATGDIYLLAYSPTARSIAIVGGCLLAVAPISSERGGITLGWIAYGATILLCAHRTAALIVFTPFAIMGAMLLVANATRSRVLRARPLIWFGSISYSLYLWHPALLWLFPGERWLAVILAVGIAAASTKLVEEPIRRGGVAALIHPRNRLRGREDQGVPADPGIAAPA